MTEPDPTDTYQNTAPAAPPVPWPNARAHPLATLTTAPPPPPPPAATRDPQDEPAQEPVIFPALPDRITPLLYTPEQAALLLAVRTSWLRRAAGEGAIACTYLGKHQRFSPADLTAIITAGARGYRPENDEPDPATGI